MEDIAIVRRPRPETDVTIVERKGVGHPDTLSDELAEELSREYSRYTREQFGAILHHNFDKVGLLGGRSRAEFGDGELLQPIRVLLNGRASSRFGDERIPLREMLPRIARDFLTDRFPTIDREDDIEIQYNLSTASSPGETEPEQFEEEGARAHWFTPRGKQDLPELDNLVSNDTSHGVGYAPLDELEEFVYELEQWLNGPYRDSNDWLGSDIKLMGNRVGDETRLTAAIPQIADHVPDLDTYDDNLLEIERDIKDFASEYVDEDQLEVDCNTRDDYEKGELYLTAIGSSIESGDEGLVGRGNRVNGLITPTRPMSIEGQAGKNPVYHVGKIYNVGAKRTAERIHEELGVPAEVHLISQSGRRLTDPWKTVVVTPDSVEEEAAKAMAREGLQRLPEITDDWLNGEVELV